MVVTWRQLNKVEAEDIRPRAVRVFLFGLLLGSLAAALVGWVVWR